MNYDNRCESFVTAAELRDAVTGALLSQEEARTVYWSQFNVLRQQGSTTPPALKA